MSGYFPVPVDNESATAAPTINDDVTSPYQVGSIWCDVSADKAYICMDNTDGVAVWKETTVEAAGTVTVVTGTAPIASSGGAAPDISISAATTSVAGSMSAADKTKLDGVEASADVTDAANVATAGAVMDSDISEADGILRKTGAGAYEAVKTNLSAAVAPVGTDDSAAGYAVGSQWIDTTADKEYVCLDATATAASWKETTVAPSGGGLTVWDVSFGNDGMGLSNSLGTYTVMARVLFAGSTIMGTPTTVKVVANITTATDGNIKIFDATNSLTIAEITLFTETTPTIKDMGALTNISTGEAIWEIQMFRNGTGGQAVEAHSLQLRF